MSKRPSKGPLPMKVIETEYDGYRFRSRLEARWAVFFNSLGLPYEYEKEGFEFHGGARYLPDFYLPDLESWVEIKGSPDGFDRAAELATLLAHGVGDRVYVFTGKFPAEIDSMGGHADHEHSFVAFQMPNPGGDYGHVFCECKHCGSIGIEFEARSERIGCCVSGNDGHNGASKRLLLAYEDARYARFEHCEEAVTRCP